MTTEYARYQGKRKELQLQAEALRLRIRSTITDLRRECDPVVDETQVRAELIHEHAVALETAQLDLIEVLEQIRTIDSIIGRDAPRSTPGR